MDAYLAARKNNVVDQALYAYLLSPCGAALSESLELTRLDETDADKKWHRKRREAAAELSTLQRTARAA
jgi:S-methylmethionine-dependent homocysteine/selenocysteine methylase